MMIGGALIGVIGDFGDWNGIGRNEFPMETSGLGSMRVVGGQVVCCSCERNWFGAHWIIGLDRSDLVVV